MSTYADHRATGTHPGAASSGAPGRFSSAAAQARTSTPTGVAREESTWLLVLAVLVVLLVLLPMTLGTYPWSGLVNWVLLSAAAVTAGVIGTKSRQARRVHPCGHMKRVYASLAFAIVVMALLAVIRMPTIVGFGPTAGLTLTAAVMVGLVCGAIAATPLTLTALRLRRAATR